MFILWIWFVFQTSAHSESIECLVSGSRQRFHASEWYFYPADIFAPKHFWTQEEQQVFPCSAIDSVRCNRDNCHVCPNNTNFCPLAKENILLATSRSNSIARSSLCMLKDKLMKKGETVNVYVTGGSVTIGLMANGCCADPECNPKNHTAVPCKWSLRFVDWMNAAFPAEVKLHNFAGHGLTSQIFADELSTAIARSGIRPFSENDLLMLDHSVNDFHSGDAAEYGLELLIRTIYQHSVPRSLPTIVILDAEPNPHRAPRSYPYYEAYDKVGKHYSIPVWSYRDSVLSSFSRVNQSQFVNYTNFRMNAAKDTHPGWPVHLFMADLYAGLLMHETQQWCNLSRKENKALYDTNLKLKLRTFQELPVAIRANANIACEKELLSLSYDIVTENLKPVGSYRFEPERGGWNLTIDKAGRAGGFIATKASNNGAKLIFTLNIATKDFLKGKTGFQIGIHYLRTYEHAGKNASKCLLCLMCIFLTRSS